MPGFRRLSSYVLIMPFSGPTSQQGFSSVSRSFVEGGRNRTMTCTFSLIAVVDVELVGRTVELVGDGYKGGDDNDSGEFGTSGVDGGETGTFCCCWWLWS